MGLGEEKPSCLPPGVTLIRRQSWSFEWSFFTGLCFPWGGGGAVALLCDGAPCPPPRPGVRVPWAPLLWAPQGGRGSRPAFSS